MNRVFILLSFLFCQLLVNAQNADLTVQLDNQQKPYLMHKVDAKENFYSIGRMYNISPSLFIAPYNGLDLKNGLSIGQTIRIPLNENNFWQSGSRKENESVVPLYHIVQSKETVSSVSKLYNMGKDAFLSWNNITGEKINVGQKVIIGFLKVDKNLSSLASKGAGPRAEPNLPKPEEKPKVQEPQVNTSEVKEEVKEIEKPKEQPKAASVKDDVKKENTVVKKTADTVISKSKDADIVGYKGKGVFEDDYKSQDGNKKDAPKRTLSGGSFKSTSGWSDGKYYILIDGIEKGKIIQLVNPSNKKVVYAKVLASVSETKPGAKELFLISNATAAQLETAGNNFDLEIVE